jgi:hypothetical protein
MSDVTCAKCGNTFPRSFNECPHCRLRERPPQLDPNLSGDRYGWGGIDTRGMVKPGLAAAIDLSQLPPPAAMVLDGERRHNRHLRRALVIVMGAWIACGIFALWSGLQVGELRRELATERERNPCSLVAGSMVGIEIMLRQAGGDLERLRVAGAAGAVLHPVASKCSGRDSSFVVQRFAEARTLDEQLAALRELRAMVQP